MEDVVKVSDEEGGVLFIYGLLNSNHWPAIPHETLISIFKQASNSTKLV